MTPPPAAHASPSPRSVATRWCDDGSIDIGNKPLVRGDGRIELSEDAVSDADVNRHTFDSRRGSGPRGSHESAKGRLETPWTNVVEIRRRTGPSRERGEDSAVLLLVGAVLVAAATPFLDSAARHRDGTEAAMASGILLGPGAVGVLTICGTCWDRPTSACSTQSAARVHGGLTSG